MSGKWILLVACGLLLFVPAVGIEAAVYYHVDDEGTPHFTDAPTKAYFRPMPGFGLPPGINLTRGQYAELIDAIASENGVDPALVKAIIRAESNFDRQAISRKGAQGLMQLMPRTAWRYAVGNTFDPADNIRGGVRHLRFLQDQFPGQPHLAVAAYNAGEKAVLRYNGIPPFAETREYVTRVFQFYGQPDVPAAALAAPPASQRTARVEQAQRVPSTPSVYRRVEADGTPHYTNLPPLVQSTQPPAR
jgi:hypothetical protein